MYNVKGDLHNHYVKGGGQEKVPAAAHAEDKKITISIVVYITSSAS